MIFVSLALLTGFLITTNRVFNARLGISLGVVPASLCNFAIGFFFLMVLVVARGEWYHPEQLTTIPLIAWLSGPLGVLFLGLATWVYPRLGAARSTILIIAGQLITAGVVEGIQGKIASFPIHIFGIALILVGVTMSRMSLRSVSRRAPAHAKKPIEINETPNAPHS